MTDVVIVGAGPVGLLLASLLSRRGFHVLVLEQKQFRDKASNAIGISPPSLDLLSTIGLAEPLLLWGAAIRKVVVHGSQGRHLGDVSFADLPPPHNCILAVPQSVTESLLEQHLAAEPLARIEYGWEFVSLDQDDESVTLVFHDTAGNPRVERSSFVVGCDGVRSRVREAIDLGRRPKKFDSTFLMGDFPDNTTWGNEAHLFFTADGAVESFPLGQSRRRWIVQTPSYQDEPGDYLETEVEKRTGHRLESTACTWKSPFGINRWVSGHYAFGRVYLAGDSAHQMSPIGGQGMNTGFADAEHLAALLQVRRDHPTYASEEGNQWYSRIRRKAARTAAARAELSMAVGTIRGRRSWWRNRLLSFALKRFPQFFPERYAMLTIPYCKFSDAQKRHPRIFSLYKETL